MSDVEGGAGGVLRRIIHKTPRELAQRALIKASDRLNVSQLEFPLSEHDVWDSGRPLGGQSSPAPPDPLRVAWLTVPPGVGSGGHTTLFRMIRAAGDAGLRNTLLFYDRYGGDFETNVARLRQGWPWLQCEVAPAPASFSGFDAYVASSWPTAHVLASRAADASAARFYFIQDYEPFFYPRGALYTLAEDTYRFGLHNIALGHMVEANLRREAGASSRVVPFGCDRGAYRLLEGAARPKGVVFFAKINSDRRGFAIAIRALREFQGRRPEVPIHVYGDRVPDRFLRATNHGYLDATALNALYNSVNAGLVLSFTNISLIPFELAAAGVVPVMNELDGGHEVFDNPNAIWAPSAPSALADALERAVDLADPDLPRLLSSWPGPAWEDTAAALIGILRETTGHPQREVSR